MRIASIGYIALRKTRPYRVLAVVLLPQARSTLTALFSYSPCIVHNYYYDVILFMNCAPTEAALASQWRHPSTRTVLTYEAHDMIRAF